MLRGGIQNVYLRGGFQVCYDEAIDILGKVATLIEKKDPRLLREVDDLEYDVNIYFDKVAKMNWRFLYCKRRLSRGQSDLSEIVNDMMELREKWLDPQYEEFQERVFKVIEEFKFLTESENHQTDKVEEDKNEA